MTDIPKACPNSRLEVAMEALRYQAKLVPESERVQHKESLVETD